MSLILRPDCPVGAGLGRSFVSAIAMCDTIGSVMPPMVTVTAKWPNDILLNGKKLAGILFDLLGPNFLSEIYGDRYNTYYDGMAILVVVDELQRYDKINYNDRLN